MTGAALPWLRAQLRSHNLHAFGLALLSLIAAVLAWYLFYFFFGLLLLGAVTVARGEWESPLPWWVPAVALAFVGILAAWGVADHVRRRYAGVSDREIIGWHLPGEFLLLPMRLTFAVWGNLSAIRWLDVEERAQAWRLLMAIHKAGRMKLSGLALIEPDAVRLYRLVSTLQLLDLIDLHRGENDWFHTVRSTRLDELRKLENEELEFQ